MDDLKELIVLVGGFFGIVFVAVVLLVFIIGSLVQLSEIPTCRDLDAVSSLDYNWTFWTGCRVNIDGIWVHYSDVTYDTFKGDLRIKDE